MSQVTEILCIRCPKGCKLRIEIRKDSIKITGNACPVGEIYGKEEIRNPKRVVTSTVRILNAKYPRLPVRTSKPVPKDSIREIIKALTGIVIEAPVRRGQIIIKNVANTGADIIAERDMGRVD